MPSTCRTRQARCNTSLTWSIFGLASHPSLVPSSCIVPRASRLLCIMERLPAPVLLHYALPPPVSTRRSTERCPDMDSEHARNMHAPALSSPCLALSFAEPCPRRSIRRSLESWPGLAQRCVAVGEEAPAAIKKKRKRHQKKKKMEIVVRQPPQPTLCSLRVMRFAGVNPSQESQPSQNQPLHQYPRLSTPKHSWQKFPSKQLRIRRSSRQQETRGNKRLAATRDSRQQERYGMAWP